MIPNIRTVKTQYRMTEFRDPSGDLARILPRVTEFIDNQEEIEGGPIEVWSLNSYDEHGHLILLFWSAT
jgi:hypothetical protein